MEALRLGVRVGIDGGNDGWGSGVAVVVDVGAGRDCEGEGFAGELDDAGAVELVGVVEFPGEDCFDAAAC
jgi:hypothetical protein